MRTRILLSVLLALAACSPTQNAADAGITFHQNVLPIVQDRCQGCHLAGGIAPFSLASYEDAKAHHTDIAAAVTSRRMPPWMPSDQCTPLKDSRRMSQEEIDTLVSWSEQGALEGQSTNVDLIKPLPELPWVDATLDPGQDYTPSTTRIDDYRCFVLDPQLSGDKDVIGFDVVPGVRHQVHHVLVYAMNRSEIQQLDDADPGLGWTCFGGPGAVSPRLIAGWVPGTGMTRLPGQTGLAIYTGEILVMQVHYNMANGPPEPDRTSIKLQYSKNPVALRAQFYPLRRQSFAIPPKAVEYSKSDTIEMPVPGTVWGIVPHMHTKGVSLKVTRETAEGEKCLIDIPKWDFHWQQFYFFDSRVGLHVEAGEKITITCTWTNPTDKEVRWGEGTDDEMCLAFAYLTGGL